MGRFHARFSRTFRVWDLTKNTLAADLPSQSEIVEMGDVGFSPDSRRVLTGEIGGYTFWDVGIWKPQLSFPFRGGIGSMIIDFTNDGKSVALFSEDRTVTQFDLASGKPQATFTVLPSLDHTWMRFSHDDKRLAFPARTTTSSFGTLTAFTVPFLK